jgi:uncharacterized protein (TIGR02391 family)
MPYHIIKKIKLLHKGSSVYLPLFGIDLEDDKTWSNFKLYFQPSPEISGEAVKLLDLDGNTRDSIKKPFEFPTYTTCFYTDGTNTVETRLLYMPPKLVQAYGIDENMAIELILNEVVYDWQTGKKEKVAIYESKMIEGPKDITPKNEEIVSATDKFIENKNINALRKLIEEGKLLRDKSPKLGDIVSFSDNTLRENEIECHKWCMKTNSFLIRIFGENSRQSDTFMANFANEYQFKNFLGIDGGCLRYFYDNVGKAVMELEVLADDFDVQLEAKNKLTLDSLFNALHLHTKVIEVSQDLFKNGHYSEAILKSLIALNENVKEKAGITERDGFDLMNHVFQEERPILKLNELRTRSEKDEQKGFRFIFAGSMAGIRNPKAHKIVAQKDPYKTLEYLSLVSLLFRRLDEAKKN